MSTATANANMDAVLLMAYGSPQTPEDIPAYLTDIRGPDRPPPQSLIDEITERYALIGGSPLNQYTMDQADAVTKELATRGADFPVFVGMRHWHPKIATVVKELADKGHRQITAMVLSPHYAKKHMAGYRRAIETAAVDGLEVRFVDSWARQPQLLSAQSACLRAALQQVSPQHKLRVLFTAHSLPKRLVGDPDMYSVELQQNAEALAQACGCDDWSFAFQSVSGRAQDWLGPTIESVIDELPAQGYDAVLAAPIGFVCDHVEVLYDLDIAAQEQATAAKLAFHRMPTVHGKAAFTAAICDAILGV